ncbi:6-phosphogluconolactonase [Parapedobacter sp. ISTM3]|uniref:6-phosphogluconolactonase n=1 Tax=Parapedobacter sp. ISTM3 TaxID=2800130 RepID=UPI0019075B48|nr:6-phosphogluconolactonase [Parapedobacter sp. ISTM3]MBK1438833.1 6-phosphogluconolactonase [Parapedobacter sp. ISTM3]
MVKRFNDLQQLNGEAAELFIQTANEAIAARGHFTVALTGGSSPAALYQLLATVPYRDQVQWEHVYIFWGDERWVPLSDDRSNARMAFETLLTHVPIPEEHIFPMWADGVSPEEFAREYEQTLRLHLHPEGRFDLILLGMGPDGHTASWFPHTDVLHEQHKWVVGYYLDAQDMYRITLTVPLVNRAARVAVIAYGANKADALYEVLKGVRNSEQYPAQLLDIADERITWFVDEAAAARI